MYSISEISRIYNIMTKWNFFTEWLLVQLYGVYNERRNIQDLWYHELKMCYKTITGTIIYIKFEHYYMQIFQKIDFLVTQVQSRSFKFIYHYYMQMFQKFDVLVTQVQSRLFKFIYFSKSQLQKFKYSRHPTAIGVSPRLQCYGHV